MDSFRPDQIGADGSSRGRTPSLDAIARRATTLEKSYQATFATVPPPPRWRNPPFRTDLPARYDRVQVDHY